MDDAEYKKELFKKLDEEIAELKQDKNTEELADILEVIDFISQALGSNFAEVCRLKIQKAKERGGFNNKIFLKSVD